MLQMLVMINSVTVHMIIIFLGHKFEEFKENYEICNSRLFKDNKHPETLILPPHPSPSIILSVLICKIIYTFVQSSTCTKVSFRKEKKSI